MSELELRYQAHQFKKRSSSSNFNSLLMCVILAMNSVFITYFVLTYDLSKKVNLIIVGIALFLLVINFIGLMVNVLTSNDKKYELPTPSINIDELRIDNFHYHKWNTGFDKKGFGFDKTNKINNSSSFFTERPSIDRGYNSPMQGFTFKGSGLQMGL